MSNYASDLSDEQWLLIAPLIPPAKTGGRPRTTNMRRVVDACLYLLDNGCKWRSLPHGFPKWQTVFYYFRQWTKAGVLRKIQRSLYRMVRKAAGRKLIPSVVIIDSKSVKTSKTGGTRGYDGGKKVRGIKQHLAVDSLGLPLGIAVTAANVHDLKGAKKVLPMVSKFIRRPSFKKLYADGAYAAASFTNWMKQTFDATVKISKNLAQVFKRFIPAAQRWVVERTFSWYDDFRRLIVNYERKLLHRLGMLRLGAISMMLNKLAPAEHKPAW